VHIVSVEGVSVSFAVARKVFFTCCKAWSDKVGTC